MKFRIKPGLEIRRVGEESIIMDPKAGRFVRLSPRATAYWRYIDEPQTAGAGTTDPEVERELVALGLVESDHPVDATGTVAGVHAVQYHAFTVYASVVANCGQYTSPNTCNNDPFCTWVGGQTKTCVPK